MTIKTALAGLAVFALIGSGCGGSAEVPGTASAECPPKLADALGAWGEAGFSGSISVATGDRIDCAVAFGQADRASERPNTPATVFNIGSITKAFTAAAILELADAGRLSLADHVGDVLPDLHGPVAEATLRDLLLHTSGLVGSHGEDHEPMTLQQALAAIGSLDQASEPGTRFLYSNAGYTLLAIIIERTSGMSYRDYIATHILPLPDGMLAGGYWDGDPAAPPLRAIGYLEDGSAGEQGDFPGPYWAVDGNGGLAMTMPALGQWTNALFRGQIISDGATEMLKTTAFSTHRRRSEIPGWVVYDKSVFGERAVATAGGGGDVGQDAIVAWLPDSGQVIAAASNTPVISAEDLLQAIGPALAKGELPPPPQNAGAPVASGELEALAGRYTADRGEGSFDVTADGETLQVAANGSGAVEALFDPESQFDPEQIAMHEELVRRLLNGDTPDGATERAALERNLGPIDEITLEGTIATEGELHTYVTVRSGSSSLLLWYAVNDEGAIEAAQGPADRPTLSLVASDDRTFVPDDPTGTGPPVEVRFAGDDIRIISPQGEFTASRSGE